MGSNPQLQGRHTPKGLPVVSGPVVSRFLSVFTKMPTRRHRAKALRRRTPLTNLYISKGTGILEIRVWDDTPRRRAPISPTVGLLLYGTLHKDLVWRLTGQRRLRSPPRLQVRPEAAARDPLVRSRSCPSSGAGLAHGRATYD